MSVLSVARAPWGRDLDPVIAIDGQAGSGKSTVSALLGERCGVPVLTTGVYFRAITKVLVDSAHRKHLDLSQSSHDLAELLRSVVLKLVGERVFVNEVDVSDALRSSEVTELLPLVSANPLVRAMILSLERHWVREHGSCVVEGRDIGSVVFPNAYVKFFLTASDEIRQARRSEEGASVLERDRRDATRTQAPSVPARDAVVVDTTNMSVSEVVHYLEEIVTFRVVELTSTKEREYR
ncbi:MAG: (d)CMP kinase [Acidimicrobiales bacterium]